MRGAPHAAFFRIEAVFVAERVVRLRLQRFCLEWLPPAAELPSGAVLEVAHGERRRQHMFFGGQVVADALHHRR